MCPLSRRGPRGDNQLLIEDTNNDFNAGLQRSLIDLLEQLSHPDGAVGLGQGQ